VTSYSTIIINQYKLEVLKLGLDIFYSDTDSLVLKGTLPESMVDSATLGKLKLEYKFKEGRFIRPKVYYLELEDGTIISKGKAFSGKLTKAQYLALLNGKSIDLKVTKWTRSLKNSKVQILRNTPYQLNFIFNKRQRILQEGVWVNTAPLILKS